VPRAVGAEWNDDAVPPSPSAPARVALARHRRPVLLVLAVAVLVATAVPVAVAQVTERRADDEARGAVAGLSAAARGVRVTTSSADDPATQRRAADATFAATVPGVTVLTTRLTYPVDARSADDPAAPARAVVLEHADGWAALTRLADGRAPRPGGDAVEVVAPRASGVTTGTRLLVGDPAVPVTVVGTWEPRDPGDALWFADPGLAAGRTTDQRTAIGPLFTADDAGVDRAVDVPLVRWTLSPAARALTADGLARTARGMAGLRDALTGAGALVHGATLEGQGGTALAAVAGTALAARDLARSALVAGLGAAALALVTAALAFEAGTRAERRTLLARGARTSRLLARDAPAVLLVALVAGGAGWGAAALVAASGAVAYGGAAAVLGALVTLAVAGRRLPVDARPARVPALTSLAVLLVATALATWRLLGTAGEPDALGRTAPLLLLVCAGLLAGLLVRRPWPPGAAAALAAGAATYAFRTTSPTVRAAWTAAAVSALVVAVIAVAGAVAARRAGRRPPGAAARPPAAPPAAVVRYAASAAVACALGVAVAMVTAGPVLGLVA